MTVRAGDIMTDSLTVFSEEDRVGSVRETMNEEDFDVAPVRISGYIRKYVHQRDLKGVSPTDRVVKHAETIEEQHLLGQDIPVIEIQPNSRDLLTVLYDREMEFAFIINDGIEGIVTHADLNKVQASIPLYRLISELEVAICDLIDDEVEHDRWLSVFDDKDKNKIKSFYAEQREENAELRLIDCLNTRFLNKIILEYELWSALCFSEEEKAEEVLKDFKGLRDDVMHQRPIVGEHTFREFVETVEELKEANESISS